MKPSRTYLEFVRDEARALLRTGARAGLDSVRRGHYLALEEWALEQLEPAQKDCNQCVTLPRPSAQVDAVERTAEHD